MTHADLPPAIGTALLFEDEHIRVWLLELKPGEASPWHRHDHPYAYLVTRPGHARTEYSDGRVEDQHDRLGHVSHRSPDPGHRLINLGPDVYQNVIVEFRDQR